MITVTVLGQAFDIAVDIKSSRDPQTMAGFEDYADLIWHPGDEPRELPLRKTEKKPDAAEAAAPAEEVAASETTAAEETSVEETAVETMAEEEAGANRY